MSCLITGVSSLARTGIDYRTTYTAYITDFAAIREQEKRKSGNFFCSPSAPGSNQPSTAGPEAAPGSASPDCHAGVIFYGLSSYVYDLGVSDEFKNFTNVNSAIIDRKAFDERSFVSFKANSMMIPFLPIRLRWRVRLRTFGSKQQRVVLPRP